MEHEVKQERYKLGVDYNDWYEKRYVIYREEKSFWSGRQFKWYVSYPYSSEGYEQRESAVKKLEKAGHLIL